MRYCDNNCGMDLEYAPKDVTTCYGCRQAARVEQTKADVAPPTKATPLRVGERIRLLHDDAIEASHTYEVYHDGSRLMWVCVDEGARKGIYGPLIKQERWSRVDGTPIDWEASGVKR